MNDVVFGRYPWLSNKSVCLRLQAGKNAWVGRPQCKSSSRGLLARVPAAFEWCHWYHSFLDIDWRICIMEGTILINNPSVIIHLDILHGLVIIIWIQTYTKDFRTTVNPCRKNTFSSSDRGSDFSCSALRWSHPTPEHPLIFDLLCGPQGTWEAEEKTGWDPGDMRLEKD